MENICNHKAGNNKNKQESTWTYFQTKLTLLYKKQKQLFEKCV